MHRRHARGSRIKARSRVEAQSGPVHMIIDWWAVVQDFAAGASCNVTASGVCGDLLVTADEPQVQTRQLFPHLDQHSAHWIRQPDVFDQLQGADKAVRRTRDH